MSGHRVIAIDPGDTTGYAFGTVTDGTIALDGFGQDEWLAFCEWLYGALINRRFDAVVVESWRLRGRAGSALTGSALIPVQAIGAIRLSCALSRTPLHAQEPAIKSVIDRMMDGTAYLPTGSTHAKDAARHLFYHFMTTTKGDMS